MMWLGRDGRIGAVVVLVGMFTMILALPIVEMVTSMEIAMSRRMEEGGGLTVAAVARYVLVICGSLRIKDLLTACSRLAISRGWIRRARPFLRPPSPP